MKSNPGRIRYDNITAEITILYDGDDSDKRDFGIRSPDNLVWADNGYVYIREDRSVGGFGTDSGEEASIWRLDPATYEVTRVAQIDRSAVPAGQTDFAPGDLGNWESSGVIDLTEQSDAEGTLLFFNVQAHSLRGGAIDPVRERGGSHRSCPVFFPVGIWRYTGGINATGAPPHAR